MVKKKVTLSLDEQVYQQFQEFCKDNDIMLSKRVERIMKKELHEDTRLKSFSHTKKLHEFLGGNKR
jgi:hypothetical protein